MSLADTHIIIDRFEKFIITLVLVDEDPFALYFDYEGQEHFLGAVINAKLIQKLPSGMGGFLEDIKSKEKLYAKKINKETQTGETYPVQLKKLYDRSDDKDSAVTMNLSYQGKFLVYMPADSGVHISKKQDSRLDVDALKKEVPELTQGGWILRSSYSSSHHSVALLKQEAKFLISNARQAEFKGYNAYQRALLDMAGKSVSVSLDESIGIEQELLSDVQDCQEMKSPLEQLGYDEFIHELLDLTTLEFQGGELHFHQIPHGPVFIDIDCHFSEKQRAKDFLALTKEIMRFIRLKNYSGVILIDYPAIKDKQVRASIMQELERQKRFDHQPIHLLGFSKAGHFELVRERRGPVFERKGV